MEDHTGIRRTRSATSELVYRIRARIREQELLPGEKLGSERALADSLGVSRSDLRNALTVLESDHEIIRKIGRAGGHRHIGRTFGTQYQHGGIIADDRAKTRHARFVESIAGGDCPGFRFRRAFAAIGRASIR